MESAAGPKAIKNLNIVLCHPLNRSGKAGLEWSRR